MTVHLFRGHYTSVPCCDSQRKTFLSENASRGAQVASGLGVSWILLFNRPDCSGKDTDLKGGAGRGSDN